MPFGYTVDLTSNKNIQPGESGSITVTLDAKNLQGRVSKSVIIHSNDPDNRVSRLYVQAVVAVDVEIKPSSLSFGKIPNDENLTKQLFIVNHMEHKELLIKKRKIIPNTNNLVCSHEKIDKNKHQVDVTLKKGCEFGNFHARLVIHTNSKKQPTINVNVKAVIHGDIVTNPERISFGIINTGSRHTRKLKIFHRKNKEFKILEYSCSEPDLKLGLDETSNGYELSVMVPEDISITARLSGTIILKTSSKTQPELQVQFYGVIRKNNSKKSSVKQPSKNNISGK